MKSLIGLIASREKIIEHIEPGAVPQLAEIKL
jgi:hypothetical protein